MSFCISLANLCKSLCVWRGCGPGTRVEGKLFDFENEVFENEQGGARFYAHASLNLKLFQARRQVGNSAAVAIPPKSAMVLEKWVFSNYICLPEDHQASHR
jgi:hypothetical protein